MNFYCDKVYFRFKGKLIKISGQKSGKGESRESKGTLRFPKMLGINTLALGLFGYSSLARIL